MTHVSPHNCTAFDSLQITYTYITPFSFHNMPSRALRLLCLFYAERNCSTDGPQTSLLFHCKWRWVDGELHTDFATCCSAMLLKNKDAQSRVIDKART